MNVKESKSYDNHELVSFCDDTDSGLRAIVAVHNTSLGPAVGGCRMFPYASQAQALEDVLRLSRGMTYKSALAGLPMGGGKAVIIGNPETDKTPQLLKSMGRFIESLNGSYITAEDSGTSVADLKVMATETKNVLGVNEAQEYGGDPSPLTALGIFHGIRAGVAYKYGRNALAGTVVAVQGAGAVGRYLIKLLHDAGAKTKVSDINIENLRKAEALGATVVDVDNIISTPADVFAPCAMGAVLNDQSIPQLAASVVAGGANNQLAELDHAERLRQLDILYAPDFVINAGGIIEICRQLKNTSMDQCRQQIERIGITLTNIFEQSDALGLSTAVVAERIAESKFNRDQATSSVA